MEKRTATPRAYTPQQICNTCGGRADRPYRLYDDAGEVINGCVDALHAGYFVTPSASASWHHRPEAQRIRRALHRRLKGK